MHSVSSSGGVKRGTENFLPVLMPGTRGAWIEYDPECVELGTNNGVPFKLNAEAVGTYKLTTLRIGGESWRCLLEYRLASLAT